MNFLELVKDRYSVRKFDSKKVEKEKLDLILEAGRVAPTAVNYQPQRILVLDSEESLSKLKETTPYHFNAPLALVICYDNVTSWKNSIEEDEGIVDASIVTTHMMLQAAEIGIGSTWVGSFDFEKLREVFDIPEFLTPVAILPLGYPAENSKPIKLHFNRFDLKETVFYNSFDGIEIGEEHLGKH